MRSTLPPSVLPDISPTRGEIGCHLGFRQSSTLQKARKPKLPISPLVGEMSGRTEGGAKERRLRLIWFLLTAFLLAFASPPPPPPPRSTTSSSPGWKTTSGPRPNRAAFPRATFDAAFAGVTPNLELPDLVMPGEKAKTPKKQHQAEFGSPGNYFAEKTVGAVTAGGRARAGKYAKTLAAIEKTLWRAGRRRAGHLGPRIRLRLGQDSV